MTALLGRAAGVTRRAGVALATALMTLTACRSAAAYCRTTTTPIPASYSPTKAGCYTDGLVLFWKGQCVGYSVNNAASLTVDFATATQIIDTAFGTWNAATCDSGVAIGIQTSNLGGVDCSEVKYNQNGPNQNLIVFRDDVWPYSDPNNTLGLTTVTFNSDTGEIYDADMEINATAKNLTTSEAVPANGYDLLSVITHEAGHFLGLAHATASTSTMYASYRPGTSSLRTLAPDDIAGVCSIYPTSAARNVDVSVDPTGVLASTACDTTPRHGFSTSCDSAAVAQDTTTSSSSGGCNVVAPSATAPGRELPWSTLVVAAGSVLALAQLRRRRR